MNTTIKCAKTRKNAIEVNLAEYDILYGKSKTYFCMPMRLTFLKHVYKYLTAKYL